jgi:uncharacterized protein YeaO (DUF488 family)
MKTTIGIRRLYDEPGPGDGIRILVDRLWPRGFRRDDERIHHWVKEVAPSPELRRWYAHDADRWKEFLRRYHAELDAATDAVEQLRRLFTAPRVTLLFATKERRLNNAAALQLYLDRKA